MAVGMELTESPPVEPISPVRAAAAARGGLGARARRVIAWSPDAWLQRRETSPRPTRSGPTEAGAVEGQRAPGSRAELTHRRRRPSGAGTGREYRPSPSTAAASPAGSPGPQPGRSGARRRCTGGPSRRRDRTRRRTALPAAARQLHSPVVVGDFALDLPVRVRIAQAPAVGEGEVLQMRAVPAGERVVDSVGELFEDVAARGREDPSWPRPVLLAVTLDQVDPDRQPSLSHFTPPVGQTQPGCLAWQQAGHFRARTSGCTAKAHSGRRPSRRASQAVTR